MLHFSGWNFFFFFFLPFPKTIVDPPHTAQVYVFVTDYIHNNEIVVITWAAPGDVHAHTQSTDKCWPLHPGADRKLATPPDTT